MITLVMRLLKMEAVEEEDLVVLVEQIFLIFSKIFLEILVEVEEVQEEAQTIEAQILGMICQSH